MVKQENFFEEIFVKVGPQELNFKPNSPTEKIFLELVADYVHKRFNETKQSQIDTMRSYAYTLMDIAKEKISLERKIEQKLSSLELKISSIIEKINSCLTQ